MRTGLEPNYATPQSPLTKTVKICRKSGVPGDSETIHLATPPPFWGAEKKKFPVFLFTYVLWNNRTWEEYPRIKANNVPSHHTRRTPYITWWYCSVTIHYLHILVVQRSLKRVLRPSQAFHDDGICECRILLARDFSDSGVQDIHVIVRTEEAGV